MISFFIFYAIILCKEDKNMKPNIEELRKKYMDNPPDCSPPQNIRTVKPPGYFPLLLFFRCKYVFYNRLNCSSRNRNIFDLAIL